MNEQDKKAFNEWFQSKQGDPYNSMFMFAHDSWKAACEYKDKQITELEQKLSGVTDDYLRRHKEATDRFLQIAELEQQLAECQAREARLREFCEFAWRDIPMNDYASELLDGCLTQPQDLSALDAMLAQARHDALMEAAEEFYECPKRTRITVDYTDEEVADRLRRMAEEQLK